MESSKQAIVLLSGGLDSAACLAFSIEEGWSVPLAITFDYGQRSSKEEQRNGRKIADFYHVPHQVISLPWFPANESALLNPKAELPKPNLHDLEDIDLGKRHARAVWVPNRNGVFLEIAAALAESKGINHLLVGFNAEEAKTFPDNSTHYLEALNKALSYSTSNKVNIVAPTAKLDKKEIVRRAKEINFPFFSLWSCYEKGDIMCGSCESCMRLKRALKENEVSYEGLFADPLF